MFTGSTKIIEWIKTAKSMGAINLIISEDSILFMHEPTYVMKKGEVTESIKILLNKHHKIKEIINID